MGPSGREFSSIITDNLRLLDARRAEGTFFSFSVWLHILQRQGYSNYSEFPLLPFQRRFGQTGISPSVESEDTDGLQLSSTANEATLVTLPWRNISTDISLTLNC